MPRKRSPALTDGELRIMRVLWERARATVGDVVQSIDATPRPAYNTVLTVLRILERKGYVRHEKDGRAFAYVPLIDHTQARRRDVSHLISRFFNNSPELLVLDLLGHEPTDAAELQRVQELIDEAPRADETGAIGRTGR
jgi:BlaI family transcriptional regulator, penicillinase repressor